MAFELLATSLTDALYQNDDFLIFLVKQLVNYKLEQPLQALISTLLPLKTPAANKDLLLHLADLLDPQRSFALLKALFEAHGHLDKHVQSRYLAKLAELNLPEALKVQQKLLPPVAPDLLQDDDYLTQLIDEGMPERKKERKTKNVV